MRPTYKTVSNYFYVRALKKHSPGSPLKGLVCVEEPLENERTLTTNYKSEILLVLYILSQACLKINSKNISGLDISGLR